jgi:uncharacterized membrane protein
MTGQPFFIPAVLIALISVPLILGLVPRNRLYGVRTRKTLSDDRIWYPANRLGGWLLLASSALYVLISTVVPYEAPTGSLAVWLLHLGAFVGPLLVSLLWIRQFLSRQ